MTQTQEGVAKMNITSGAGDSLLRVLGAEISSLQEGHQGMVGRDIATVSGVRGARVKVVTEDQLVQLTMELARAVGGMTANQVVPELEDYEPQQGVVYLQVTRPSPPSRRALRVVSVDSAAREVCVQETGDYLGHMYATTARRAASASRMHEVLRRRNHSSLGGF